MASRSKALIYLIPAMTALILSRATFLFLNDPEGPNLLIVTVLAAVLYGISLLAYKISNGSKKIFCAILIQAVLALCLGLYFM